MQAPEPGARDQLATAEPRMGPPPSVGVSARALLIVLAALLVLLPVSLLVEQWAQVTRGWSERVPPIAGLGMTFLLTLASQLLARRRRGLHRQEILTIYVLLSIGLPMVSLGVTLWFLSCSLGIHYHVHQNTQWQAAFFQHIPPWFYPGDPAAIDGFFQGQSTVPWHSWLTPLAAWGSYFLALFVAALCVFLLVRRQWVTNERLTYPIAQVPLEMVRETGEGGARLPATPAFWIGFAVCAVLYLQQRLPEIYPALPHLEIWGFRLVTTTDTGPLTGLGDLWLYLLPWTIALAYLMPKDLSFSVWFFYLIRVLCTVLAIVAGASPRRPEEWGDSSFPAPNYQGGGAVIALGLMALWAGRKQIGHAVRAAYTGSRERDDGLPYRWVVAALLLSVSYLLIFCWSAGMRPLAGIALIGLILTVHLVWARLRAENGMSFIGFPLMVDDYLFRPLGNGIYRPAEIITIYATRWSYTPGWGESCECITGSAADAMKIAEAGRLRIRPLTLAMVGVFVFALICGLYIELSFVYQHGYYRFVPLPGWQEGMTQGVGAQIFDAVNSPSRADPGAIIALLSGMAVTLLLTQLRLRFWWWPLHPVGYVAANVWGAQWWWNPLFIGWLLKSLTIRYGGLRLYQRLVPAAIGIIVADATCQMLAALALWLARGGR